MQQQLVRFMSGQINMKVNSISMIGVFLLAKTKNHGKLQPDGEILNYSQHFKSERKSEARKDLYLHKISNNL